MATSEDRIRRTLQHQPGQGWGPSSLQGEPGIPAFVPRPLDPIRQFTQEASGALLQDPAGSSAKALKGQQAEQQDALQGSAGFPSMKQTPGLTGWVLDPDAKNPQGQPQGTFPPKAEDMQRGVFPALNQEWIPTAADTPENDERDNNTWMTPEEFKHAHGGWQGSGRTQIQQPRDAAGKLIPNKPVQFDKKLQGRPSSGALMSAKDSGVFRPGLSFEDILTTQRYADSKFAPGQDILTGSEVRSEPHASSHPTTKPQYTSSEGVADNSTKRKSPYQVRQNNSDPQGLPREEGMGHMVFDGTANDGKGGFRNRAPDQPAANTAAETGNIHAEARALNLNPDDPKYQDDPASLELDVARMQDRAKTKERMFKTVSIPGGGSGYTANDRANSQDDDRRRNQWVAEQSRRYGPQMKANNISEVQLGEAYDEGLKNSKGKTQQQRHTDAGLAGTVMVTSPGGLKNTKNNQISQNIENNWSQINRGRKWGVSQGQVAFFDSLQNAKTPMEQANVLLLAHSANPQAGYGDMAALVMKGKIETDQLSQWAAGQGAPKPGAPEKLQQDIQNITGKPRHAGSYPALKMIARSTSGPNASEAEVNTNAANMDRNFMTTTFRPGSPPPSSADKDHARLLIADMEYTDFPGYMGLQDDKETAKLYSQITGKPAPPGPWGGRKARAPQAAAPPAQAAPAPPMPPAPFGFIR